MPSLVKISEAFSLAIHAMAFLARDRKQRFTNQAVAERSGASGHHLAKVLRRLVQAGLVASTRGPLGGFGLSRPAEQIMLLQIYEAIEGPIPQGGCLLGKTVCDGKDCVLGSLMGTVHQQIRDYLANTTLTELASTLACFNTPHDES